MNVVIGDGLGRDDPDGPVGDDPEQDPQISPTSSAPQITTIRDNGYLWRVFPSDYLQGRVLAQAAIDAFGPGETVNVGARNDAFGNALRHLFVRVQESRRQDRRTSPGTRASPSSTPKPAARRGRAEGLGDHRLPGHVPEVVPSLFRTGEWSAAKTLMTEAMRNADALKKIGAAAEGLRGTAATRRRPGTGVVRPASGSPRSSGEAVHGLRGDGVDAANLAFLAAVQAARPAGADKDNLRAVSAPPGSKVTYTRRAER